MTTVCRRAGVRHGLLIYSRVVRREWQDFGNGWGGQRMASWARSPESREQVVPFPQRLDDAVSPRHPVRLVDEILSRLDRSAWEQGHDLTRGQPPIHPRVLAGVLLYGLMTRVRSSRALEEALQVRLDFRWLAEGRTIDHTGSHHAERVPPAASRAAAGSVCANRSGGAQAGVRGPGATGL